MKYFPMTEEEVTKTCARLASQRMILKAREAQILVEGYVVALDTSVKQWNLDPPVNYAIPEGFDLTEEWLESLRQKVAQYDFKHLTLIRNMRFYLKKIHEYSETAAEGVW